MPWWSSGTYGGVQAAVKADQRAWFARFGARRQRLQHQVRIAATGNGGGRIEREYALGRGRTDLLIVWPHGGRERRFVVECKVLRKELERTIAEGVEQTRGYVDRCGAEAGHLIAFDRAPQRTWAEKSFRRAPSGVGVPVTVWGM